MIRQRLEIEEYGWTVWCYYAVDTYYVDEIMDRLVSIGCGGEFLAKAERNMRSGKLNHGLTYSNPLMGESVFVIGLTSSAAEFFNSIVHEMKHLVEHIGEMKGIDPKSEESAYLAGDTAQKCFPYIVSLLCEHCRENKHNHKYRRYV